MGVFFHMWNKDIFYKFSFFFLLQAYICVCACANVCSWVQVVSQVVIIEKAEEADLTPR